MQTARTPLPELEFIRDDPISAPPLGTRHRTLAIGAPDALERFFEHVILAGIADGSIRPGADARLAMLAVLGFNLLGDGLRDLLDPRMRTL